jgi:hypothetical protein
MSRQHRLYINGASRVGLTRVQSDDLEIADGAAAGSWIAARLGGRFGAVTLQVPQDYDAYVRIFHPASDTNGKPVRWAAVASALGKVAHRRMQWHALLGMSEPDAGRACERHESGDKLWVGDDPPTGEMDVEELDGLCKILMVHTNDPEHCYFGLCTIQGWLDSFSSDELGPLLRLPMGRDYIVLSGPLWAVSQITRACVKHPSDGLYAPEEARNRDLLRDVPNLIWPSDHSWFVASEVDFDSTLLGGDIKLVEAILNSPELEAWMMEPADSLAADADIINGSCAGG